MLECSRCLIRRLHFLVSIEIPCLRVRPVFMRVRDSQSPVWQIRSYLSKGYHEGLELISSRFLLLTPDGMMPG